MSLYGLCVALTVLVAYSLRSVDGGPVGRCAAAAVPPDIPLWRPARHEINFCSANWSIAFDAIRRRAVNAPAGRPRRGLTGPGCGRGWVDRWTLREFIWGSTQRRPENGEDGGLVRRRTEIRRCLTICAAVCILTATVGSAEHVRGWSSAVGNAPWTATGILRTYNEEKWFAETGC